MDDASVPAAAAAAAAASAASPVATSPIALLDWPGRRASRAVAVRLVGLVVFFVRSPLVAEFLPSVPLPPLLLAAVLVLERAAAWLVEPDLELATRWREATFDLGIEIWGIILWLSVNRCCKLSIDVFVSPLSLLLAAMQPMAFFDLAFNAYRISFGVGGDQTSRSRAGGGAQTSGSARKNAAGSGEAERAALEPGRESPDIKCFASSEF